MFLEGRIGKNYMNKNNELKNIDFEEIDIINVIKKIWNGRYIVLICVVMSLLIGYTYDRFAFKKYISQINITTSSSIPSQPPLLELFKIEFYNEKNFDSWVENNRRSNITYEMIDSFKRDDQGYSWFDSDPLVSFKNNTIKIYSNQINYISDIFDYVNFVNLRGVDSLKRNLKIILKDFDKVKYPGGEINFSPKDHMQIRLFDFYIEKLQLVQVSPPTEPVLDKPSTKIIMFSFFLLGLFISIVIIIFRNFQPRKTN